MSSSNTPDVLVSADTDRADSSTNITSGDTPFPMIRNACEPVVESVGSDSSAVLTHLALADVTPNADEAVFDFSLFIDG